MLWSPDGKQIFCVVTQPGGFNAIMRKPAQGGNEELIYRYTPGAPLNINDITPDGKFMTFDSGGVILILPLTGGDAPGRRDFARGVLWIRRTVFAGRAVARLPCHGNRPQRAIRAAV